VKSENPPSNSKVGTIRVNDNWGKNDSKYEKRANGLIRDCLTRIEPEWRGENEDPAGN
jgi:hypothetical protein